MKQENNMEDRYSTLPADDLGPLKVVGAILWTAVIVTAFIVLW